MDKSRVQKVLRRAFWVPFGIAAILAVTLILEVRSLMKSAAWVEKARKRLPSRANSSHSRPPIYKRGRCGSHDDDLL